MTQKMYIGPSKPYNLALMSNAIIIDIRGVTGLKEALFDHPILSELLVPIEELAVSRQKVKEKGEPLYDAYMQVQKETLALRKGGK